MHVSHESVEETAQRLLQVIARAELKVYEQAYVFEEFPFGDFSRKAKPEALALVRDEHVWSQLARVEDSGGELFKTFSFHFAEGLDNSGLVGWGAGEGRVAFNHLAQRVCR